eukprot:GHVN01003447.1.p1 GENE.GHVN01003447.1~~GHVN01003447.1.p1  ORF type:complete len:403 (-),score=31.05 GHVN01003447.1:598-1806(-)
MDSISSIVWVVQSPTLPTLDVVNCECVVQRVCSQEIKQQYAIRTGDWPKHFKEFEFNESEVVGLRFFVRCENSEMLQYQVWVPCEAVTRFRDSQEEKRLSLKIKLNNISSTTQWTVKSAKAWLESNLVRAGDSSSNFVLMSFDKRRRVAKALPPCSAKTRHEIGLLLGSSRASHAGHPQLRCSGSSNVSHQLHPQSELASRCVGASSGNETKLVGIPPQTKSPLVKRCPINQESGVSPRTAVPQIGPDDSASMCEDGLEEEPNRNQSEASFYHRSSSFQDDSRGHRKQSRPLPSTNTVMASMAISDHRSWMRENSQNLSQVVGESPAPINRAHENSSARQLLEEVNKNLILNNTLHLTSRTRKTTSELAYNPNKDKSQRANRGVHVRCERLRLEYRREAVLL